VILLLADADPDHQLLLLLLLKQEHAMALMPLGRSPCSISRCGLLGKGQLMTQEVLFLMADNIYKHCSSGTLAMREAPLHCGLHRSLSLSRAPVCIRRSALEPETCRPMRQ